MIADALGGDSPSHSHDERTDGFEHRGSPEGIRREAHRGVLSPSLQRMRGLPAREVKFLVPDALAAEIETELRQSMIPDPYATSAGGYETTTLYCDTLDFRMFHRQDPHARRKYRVRRYGTASEVYLERKSKRGTRVRKRRTSISLDELPCLGESPGDDTAWSGEWFRGALRLRQLSPVLAVGYSRTAYIGEWGGHGTRLTFDRQVRGRLQAGWNVEPLADGVAVLRGETICEFKFQGSLPAPFRNVLERYRLAPGGASKYRLCAVATGLVPAVPASNPLLPASAGVTQDV